MRARDAGQTFGAIGADLETDPVPTAQGGARGIRPQSARCANHKQPNDCKLADHALRAETEVNLRLRPTGLVVLGLKRAFVVIVCGGLFTCRDVLRWSGLHPALRAPGVVCSWQRFGWKNRGMVDVPSIRPGFQERDHRIWMARAHGASLADIAAEYGLSTARISQVVKQVAACLIPDDDKPEIVKLALELYGKLRRDLVELVESPPPAFAPNGKELVDRDNMPVPDHKLQVSAIETLLKTLAQYQKLLGLDAPAVTQVSMPLVPPAEVDRVVREQAEKARLRIMRTQMRIRSGLSCVRRCAVRQAVVNPDGSVVERWVRSGWPKWIRSWRGSLR